jgi:hypothetical protein
MIDFHVDPLRRIVTTRVMGRVSLTDFACHLQRILRDPKFSAEFNALIIATDATAIPSSTSINVVQPLIKAWSYRRAGARWAFVLPTAETKTFAESMLLELRLTSVATRCFLSESAALAWLETVATSPRPEVTTSANHSPAAGTKLANQPSGWGDSRSAPASASERK